MAGKSPFVFSSFFPFLLHRLHMKEKYLPDSSDSEQVAFSLGFWKCNFCEFLKPLVHSKLGGKTLFAGGYCAYLHGYSFMGILCSSKILGFFVRQLIYLCF
jgi:hypothetical protein